MSEDAQLISGLLSDDHEVDLSFSDSQLTYITDNSGGGGYTQNIIFDTLQCGSSWNDFKESWLYVPISITCGTTFSSATSPQLAFKQSILSFFRGIQVQIAGQMVVNEIDNHFINNIRLLLENSFDWFESNRDHLQMSVDRTSPEVQSTLTGVSNISPILTSKYTAAVSGTANSLRQNFNQGFVDRNIHLLNSFVEAGTAASNTTANIQTYIYLPLQYLSQFFANMDFPILNTRMTITLLVNTTASGNPYTPICRATNPAGTAETAIATVNITTGVGGCRLYYRQVMFSPEQAVRVAAMLQKGFSKTISYNITDVNNQFTNLAAGNVTHSISSGVINPQRVWVLVLPTGVVNGQTWPSPCVTGQNGITSANILIQGKPYFINLRTNLYEFWDDLQDIQPPTAAGMDTSSILNFSDFINTYRINCFDMTRQKNKLIDPNMSIPLTFQGTLLSQSGNVDVIYLIEHKVTCRLNFGESDVKVVYGANLQ